MTELEAKSKLVDETDDRIIGYLMSERKKLQSLKESKKVRPRPLMWFITAFLALIFASYLMPRIDRDSSNLRRLEFTQTTAEVSFESPITGLVAEQNHFSFLIGGYEENLPIKA